MKKYKKSDVVRVVLSILSLIGCGVTVHICHDSHVLTVPEIIIVSASVSLSVGTALSYFIEFD